MRYFLVVPLLFIASLAAFAQAPVLFYSDLITGMCSGGENNKGNWVTVTGKNFDNGPDASHYVQLKAVSDGTITKIDSYLPFGWNYGPDPQGNYKISFQLGTNAGCVPDGDYDIQVVTPAGTSSVLPIQFGGTALVPNTHFRISSGGTIYFADTVAGHNGSDTLNDGLYPTFSASTPKNHGPFLTGAKCRQMATAAPGNACYVMPGSWISGSDSGTPAALAFDDVHGTADKYMWVLGYPTTNRSLIPKVDCPTNSTPGCTYTSLGIRSGSDYVAGASYFGVANLVSYSYGNYNAIALGSQYAGSAVHHARFVDLDLSGPNYTSSVATFSAAVSSFITLAGSYFHDVTNNFQGAPQHTHPVYIGDQSNNWDIGWSDIDMSCTIAGTCDTNKGIEIHSTANAGTAYISPRPTIQTGTGTNPGDVYGVHDASGTLPAGTYNVYVTYRSRVYYVDSIFNSTTAHAIQDSPGCFNTATDSNAACNSLETESQDASAGSHYVTVTLTGGAGTNAIKVKWPTGIDHTPVRSNAAEWDGVTTLCNPTLAYKVYACQQGVNCTNGPLYQGQVVYTDPSAGVPITSTDYLLTSINGSGHPFIPPVHYDYANTPAAGQAQEMILNGCAIYNVAYHDSKMTAEPGYGITVIGVNVDNGHYLRFYNNIFANNGTGWSWDEPDYYRVPTCASFAANDPDMKDYASGGTIEFSNNIFFNCGGPPDSYNIGGVISANWPNSGWPNRTFLFRNNIFRQTQNLARTTSSTWIADTPTSQIGVNLFFTGSNNVCWGYGNKDCKQVGLFDFNGNGSGLNRDPLFTSEGTLTTSSTPNPNCLGGANCYPVANIGYNLMPQPSSPVWGAGTAVSYVTRDINGFARPNPPSIGPYEQGVPDVTNPSVSMTAPTNGSTVTQGDVVTVSATCTDDVAVQGVQFKQDGSNLGAQDTVAPYSTTVSASCSSTYPCTRTYGATCTDTSSNSANATTVSITVNAGVAPKSTRTGTWTGN